MAIWKVLRDEFREFPATMALGTLWVVVFALMVADQAARTGRVTPGQLVIGLYNGHRVGDLSLRDLYEGEVWRALTATWVHFGLLHIGMNLFALYQLGALVESWYGSGPLVAIYVLTGAGGNLLSGLIRHALRADPAIASGGGSTVVMGLVALCAVVGWRSRTRIGAHLRNQMVWVMLLTGGLGFGLAVAGLPVIDNWGHAGGAAVGALIGLANRPLLKAAGSRLAALAGCVGYGALAASALALVVDDRSEAERGRRLATDSLRGREIARVRFVRGEYLLTQLDKIRTLYRTTAYPRALRRGTVVRVLPRVAQQRASAGRPPAGRPGLAAPAPANGGSPGVLRLDPAMEFDLTVLNASHRLLDALGPELEANAGSTEYQRARALLALTLIEPPTLDEVREFDDCLATLQQRLRLDRDRARIELLSHGAVIGGSVTALPR